MRQYPSIEKTEKRSPRWKIGDGRYISLDRVYVMGVLNATPDSFSDGGKYLTAASAASHAAGLAADGADIIDIGCQSTRPGFEPVAPEEELRRLSGVLPAVKAALPDGFPISIDTFYPDVARYALENGACIINDVSGLCNPDMRMIIAETGCGAVMMHCADIAPFADPAIYVPRIRSFLERRTEQCIAEEIDPEQLVLDPGIGFGKTREQDLFILRHVSECAVFGRPLLAAASRKRVVRQFYLEADAVGENALDEATFAAHSDAVRSGARLVRVHRVL